MYLFQLFKCVYFIILFILFYFLLEDPVIQLKALGEELESGVQIVSFGSTFSF